MKWDDSLPAEWDDCTRSPPLPEIVVKAEQSSRGLILRTPGDGEQYLFLEGDAVDVTP